MPAREEFANQIRPDEAGSPGDKTIHDWQKRRDFVAARPKKPQNFYTRPLDLN
jgi:hypothetical protein